MTSCLACGHANRSDADYCANCGSQLGQAPYVALRQGQRLQGGEYTIVRPLGRGGMGVVYLATQALAGTSRQVVVKEMLDYFDPTDARQAEAARERFQKEAATLVTLNHANVTTFLQPVRAGARRALCNLYPGRPAG